MITRSWEYGVVPFCHYHPGRACGTVLQELLPKRQAIDLSECRVRRWFRHIIAILQDQPVLLLGSSPDCVRQRHVSDARRPPIWRVATQNSTKT